MPLTPFQLEVSRLLAVNRAPDSYLAGGAALHLRPNSKRYSNDLDFFQDSEERVAKAFADDRALLESRGIRVSVQIAQPGYIRALAGKGDDCTKIEWAHDSAWRFMPPVKLPDAGYALHPVDLAVNKVLALAGRDEPRDYLDALYAHDELLPLPALLWAAVGKDPGFTPRSLLELVRRRGRYQPVDFERLRLVEPVQPAVLKEKWLAALADADRFARSRPPEESGCLYYSPGKRAFLMPGPDSPADLVAHFGSPGGVLPALYTGDALAYW
ncbi:MAG: nucleotidyl transferase AbiEii/AbiGii toxin family protein [Elusimicrobia bacterium]|nr:nucleotidyl transferase AbiEii/AbiGii toxin family protein [Elusimicrobiota bacterium]